MALADPFKVSAGITTVLGGVDSGKSPGLIRDDQLAWGENITVRGGKIRQRPGFRQIALSGSLAATMVRLGFQGGYFYEDPVGRGYLIASAGGRTFRLQLTGNTATAIEITDPADPNNDQAPIIYHQQADTNLVIQDGSSIPLIYDGANTRRAKATEVPIGSGPMAYGLGRLWVAQGYEYVAGDIRGGPTGVLSFTENTYLSEGGKFSVPLRLGQITAMQFTASPNTALGQGELFVATGSAGYSTVVPVDRDAWKDVQDPIQRVILINNGSQSHTGTVLVNGDLYIRSRDGIRSVIQAVRDFSQSGNVPISREMSRALNADDPSLLRYTSGILFDNRLLMTTRARGMWNRAYFNGLAVLDFDLISSGAERLPAAWDGVWTGLKFLHLEKGTFGGVERAFAFVRNTSKGFVKRVIVTTPQNTAQLSGAVAVVSSGGGGTGATYSARYRASSATINDAGTGYAVGDVVTMSGPTPNIRQASFLVTSVSGGSVTGISVINPGDYGTDITALNYATTTTGSGTGFRVTVVSTCFAVDVTNGGSNYTSPPVLSASFQSSLEACPDFKAVPVMEYEWELWEITRDAKFDRPLTGGDRRIESVVESKSWHFENQISLARDTKKISGAEIMVDELVGTVDFDIKYKPDEFPCWQDWRTWQYCAPYQDCGGYTPVNCQPKVYLPQLRPRNMIPEPAATCDPTGRFQMNRGREFQVRLKWTGSAAIKLLEVNARIEREQSAPPCVPTSETCVGLECPCTT